MYTNLFLIENDELHLETEANRDIVILSRLTRFSTTEKEVIILYTNNKIHRSLRLHVPIAFVRIFITEKKF